TAVGVGHRQPPAGSREAAYRRRGGAGVPTHPDRRCRVLMEAEGPGEVLLTGEQAPQVDPRLARPRIAAGDLCAVAARRLRRGAHEDVSLVGADEEQRVPGVDAVARQAPEEVREALVVLAQLGDVAG